MTSDKYTCRTAMSDRDVVEIYLKHIQKVTGANSLVVHSDDLPATILKLQVIRNKPWYEIVHDIESVEEWAALDEWLAAATTTIRRINDKDLSKDELDKFLQIVEGFDYHLLPSWRVAVERFGMPSLARRILVLNGQDGTVDESWFSTLVDVVINKANYGDSIVTDEWYTLCMVKL